ncbi:hypothetical protein FYK55_28500 [Roseiconus nitratireducens]|uniref:Uncharacterized protein n=1 Tax=Roseiconus nitratireducens TaxID=2605748 RepID=A0A5M6CNV3_9BACT|nr:hypothetical protein [Roseiconus nitratireducens]KAA5535652.1 hypothetical protein FYK55_28500 [Roseiconus nitratireducens]
MIRYLVLAVLTVCLLTHATATEPPPVEVKHLDYKSITKANDWIGLKFPDALPRDSVSRIILTQLKPVGIPGTADDKLTDQQTRDIASGLMRTLFSETGAIHKWGQLAEEGEMAELVIVTKSGKIFFVDVLRKTGEQNANAFILRGSGFSVRLTVVRDSED